MFCFFLARLVFKVQPYPIKYHTPDLRFLALRFICAAVNLVDMITPTQTPHGWKVGEGVRDPNVWKTTMQRISLVLLLALPLACTCLVMSYLVVVPCLGLVMAYHDVCFVLSWEG